VTLADVLDRWRAIEADFWRFYRVRPLEVSWRRFETFIAGLPGESAFMEQMAQEIEERDAWRKALSRATGRDYSRSTRRMTIDQYAQAGSK
jgi:hypothetical protein